MPKKLYKRTPEGYKRYLAGVKRRQIENRKDPAYRAMEAEKARLRYHKNKEKYRLIALKYRDKNKGEINAKRRLKRESATDAAKLQERKWRSNSLKAVTAKFGRGEIPLERLIERIGESTARIDERLRREERRRREGNMRMRETDNSTNKRKA